MSTIKVDTIQKANGTSQIGIDKIGGVTSASIVNVIAEGGSTTTNLSQGLAKAWCDADNAAQPQDSFNISGGVDNGTGDYQFNLTNSMGSANYAVPNSPSFAQISCFDHGDITSSRYDIRIFARTDSLSVTDDPTHSAVHGDLA